MATVYTYVGYSSTLLMTTATDPAANAAVTAAITGSYSGIVITLTSAGNAQTFASPSITTAGKIFTVVNDDSSGANTIAVNGITIPAGKSQSYIWDGSTWGPTELGITSLPVPVTQGGTGLATLTANAIYKGNGTSAFAVSSLTDDGTTLTTTENFVCLKATARTQTKTVSSTPVNLTEAECKNSVVYATTGASVINLPTGSATLDGAALVVEAIAAVAVSIDLTTGTDIIVLDGTALTAGNKVIFDGAAGTSCLIKYDATASRWRVRTVAGTISDGGA